VTRIRTSLQHAPKKPANKDELFEMRRQTWIKQGHPCFDLQDVIGWDVKEIIIQAAERLYGKSEVVK
jgi:hypothetical protein